MARILVVDDDAALRAVVRRALERDGHDVETASDGWKALQVLKRGAIDLILADVYMPDVNGVELIQRLEHLEERFPIIVMSGGGWERKDTVLERARSLGAVATLEKPFNATTLQLMVRKVLENPRLAPDG